jgi:hypothetical protein
MIGNAAYQTEVHALAANSDQTFIDHLSQALRANAFSNRLLIAPRRLTQLGREEFDRFCTFLNDQDTRLVIEHGRSLALEGLGQTSVLNLTAALRQTCLGLRDADRETGGGLFDLTECYTAALLEGYMHGREEELRQEQERTRQAFFRTQA